MNDKYEALAAWLRCNPHAAIAYSGGADSTLLLRAAKDARADCRAYYVKSAFQPAWEQRDAKRFADALDMPVVFLTLDVLACPEIAANRSDRCYHCKKAMLGALMERACADGCLTLIDGTNASDDAAERPGMRALAELRVHSPLRECGIGKAEVYALSRSLGLLSAHKPPYACLATRVEADRPITSALLMRVEQAEDLLFQNGFTDFRVRLRGGGALLQLREADQTRWLGLERSLEPQLRRWFSEITMDTVPRSNETLWTSMN